MRGVSRSSRCVGPECDGRFCFRRASADDGTKAYGEVVWSWRRDAGVKFLRSTLLRDDGGKKPAHRGERDISRKTIARGRPGCFG